MVISLSPIRATRGFTWLLTLMSHGISQGAHKLARPSTVIKNTTCKYEKETIIINN